MVILCNMRVYDAKMHDLAAFSGFKRKKALKIVAHTDQRPLALDGLQTAQQELAESHGLFDHAEDGDGLDSGFALAIAVFTCAGLEAMGIGLHGAERGLG